MRFFHVCRVVAIVEVIVVCIQWYWASSRYWRYLGRHTTVCFVSQRPLVRSNRFRNWKTWVAAPRLTHPRIRPYCFYPLLKVYANSLLATLNTRHALHVRGFESENLVSREARNQPGSSDIQFTTNAELGGTVSALCLLVSIVRPIVAWSGTNGDRQDIWR